MLRQVRIRLRKPSAYEAFAVGAAALAIGGAAYASIPASDGTFHGCYATEAGVASGVRHDKGDTRLVDEGQSCRAYEKAVTWNQTGPPGPAGSALGYAHVLADGTLDTARSKGVTASTARQGVVCLTTSFQPKNIVATVELSDAPAHLFASVIPFGDACPDGTTAIVYLLKDDGTTTRGSFYAAFN